MSQINGAASCPKMDAGKRERRLTEKALEYKVEHLQNERKRPACLLLNDLPLIAIWFLQTSTFSMLPLFLKDGLLVPYIVTSLGFLYFSIYLLSPLKHCTEEELRMGAYHKILFFLPKLDLACIVRWKFYISILAMAALGIASATMAPPSHLPDLFPVLVSTFSFLHFLGTFLYFNIVQFSEPPSRKTQKKIN